MIVEKSIHLHGLDWPIIDGENQGTVVKLLAPDTVFQGFVVRNSGASLDQENSGIAGEAPGLRIEGNRLEDTLFGIYLRDAQGSVIRENEIESKDLDVPRRGDPIRVWYSSNVLIENNIVTRGRDVVLWYSEHLTVRDNEVTEGRYGLHFMYCDDATIEGNLLAGNSVGAFLMYSRRMTLQNNTIANNRGPSGFGVGLKDMDDAIVVGNLFYDNRIGAHLDNSPREVDSIGWFEENIFGYNDIGVNLMPSVRFNQFTGNSFIENQEQVSIAGGGQLKENIWSVAARGNYWSDYAGYDDGVDGLGDVPYRSERLFENLVDRYPALGLFAFSPAAQAIDFAAKAVPLVKPQPKLTDDYPLMTSVLPEGLPILPQPDPLPLTAASWGLLGLGVITLVFTQRQSSRTAKPSSRKSPVATKENSMIQVAHLTKRFGELTAVNDLSFQVEAGEAVAFWGPNGAGKTTILHCLLGLLPFEGQIRVGDLDIGRDARAVRRSIGFVPQVLNFHNDLQVKETVNFYAQLKKTDPDSGVTLLEKLGMAEHAEKRVGELSGGMKQRLALALSLLADPDILILDEPTASLDVESRAELLDLLSGIKAEGKTLLFSSHRLDEVMDLADRVLVLRQGQLVADSPPERFIREAGARARLGLYVEHDRMDAAVAILLEKGYAASPNGKRIWVKVTSDQKGEPISALAEAGIPVRDFLLDFLEEA